MKYAKWISALMLLLVPVVAAAQLSQGEHIATQVPFKFMVGNTTVPAGKVILQLADEKGWVLAIQNPDVKLSIFSLASPTVANQAAKNSALVFRKYGDRYFLASMRIGDTRTVYEFRPGKLENEMRAQSMVPTEEVLLATAR
jgi:hypothetical protein